MGWERAEPYQQPQGTSTRRTNRQTYNQCFGLYGAVLRRAAPHLEGDMVLIAFLSGVAVGAMLTIIVFALVAMAGENERRIEEEARSRGL